jgi:hypothetical protein
MSLADALTKLNIDRDFSYSKPNAKIWFVHRHLKDADLYFINNRESSPESIEATFRVSGKLPELWHADTGVIEPVSYQQQGTRTIVPLNLDAHDAVFVVFHKSTQQRERTVATTIRERLGTVTGPWEVTFQPQRGAPDRTRFRDLRSWSTDSHPGIKYFSGTASYETTLNAPESWLKKNHHLEIDLGDVKDLAEVMVNGRSAGIFWKRPFRVDITDLLRKGTNRLTVRVTNLWPNRLIGDKQPNATPIAFTTFNPYHVDSPLLTSGLLGPVTILSVRLAGSR